MPLHATVLQAAPDSADVETVDAADAGSPPRPSFAETARTVLDIASHGTLATLDAESRPLGTYTSYVLDGKVSNLCA